MFKINGFDVNETYAGIAQYTVYKDGEDLGTCWSIEYLAKMIGTDAETVNEELWKQR